MMGVPQLTPWSNQNRHINKETRYISANNKAKSKKETRCRISRQTPSENVIQVWIIIVMDDLELYLKKVPQNIWFQISMMYNIDQIITLRNIRHEFR